MIVDMNDRKELHKQIEEILKASNFKFEKEPKINGSIPDYILHGPKRRLIIVEVKIGRITKSQVKQFNSLKRYYQKVTGIKDIIIILNDLNHINSADGFISIDSLPSFLDELKLTNNNVKPVIKSKLSIIKQDKQMFAAMPFKKEYDDTYIAMTEAVKVVNFALKRIDEDPSVGDISLKIQDEIKKSSIVIGDLSELNPNVLYEIGFAHGNNIPTILICSTNLKKLPFNIRNHNTIRYQKGRTHLLKTQLTETLMTIL
jgi:hypothetical protein